MPLNASLPRVPLRRLTALAVLALFAGWSVACSSTGAPNPGQDALPTATAITGASGPSTTYMGEKVSSLRTDRVDYGVVVPDNQGGVAVISGNIPKPPSAGYMDARELKLKIRELAEQLIADAQENALRGTFAIPTSFVNLNAMDQTSSFGRLMSEQLIYEFNQRGFPVQEFRIPKHITAKKHAGEFYLTRAIGSVAPKSPGSVVIVGTYHADSSAVFVNARIIRPSDGQVIRTANLVLDSTPVVRRLTNSKALSSGTIKIVGSKSRAPVVSANPFDQGADVH